MPATEDARTATTARRREVGPALDPASCEILELVVAAAVSPAPWSTSASVWLAPGRTGLPTPAASRQLARDLDAVQLRTGRGPCVEAVRTGQEARSSLPCPDLPDLSAAVAGTRIRSAWSLPLAHSGHTTGTLNVYSAVESCWHQPAAATVRVVAALAALELSMAADSAQLAHGNATLEEALKTRTVIGQAQGILMARERIPAPEAFDILRRASQRTNRKLRDLAAEIVHGAGDRPIPPAREKGTIHCEQ